MNGEAKHTPGPWEKDYGGTIGHIKSVSDVEHLTPTVCRYDVKTLSLTPEEKEANGYLIAAAPDLLQALTELTQSASELLAQMPLIAPKGAEILRADVEKAREVIARAKGE